MKAIVLNEYGGPNKLHYVTDAPDPELPPGGVLVALAASSVNPVDWKVRSGVMSAMMPVSFPYTPGWDLSGIVRAIGAEVGGVAVGDRVMAIGQATYAELAVVPAPDITHIPEGLDIVDAAALALVCLTGAQLILEGCELKAGQTVLVAGALGSVGRCAVHQAKKIGAKVIAGVRKHSLDAAKPLDVDGVIALDDKDDLARLGAVDAVADTVGGAAGNALLGKVREGGVFGVVTGPPQDAALHPAVRVNSISAHPDPQMVKAFAEDLRDGRFALPISRRFTLQEAGAAQTFAEKGGSRGKVLLMVL